VTRTPRSLLPVRMNAPSPLAGEGFAAACSMLTWVRGWCDIFDFRCGENPSPGAHLAMRATLSRKGRGYTVGAETMSSFGD